MPESRTPDRTPLVLLHGALGSRAQMEALASALAPRFECHAIDFVGHGASPLTGPLSVERLVEQVADFVTARALAPAAIFGYSLGGYVALQLAATQPSLVRAVATLGTKLEWTPKVAERMAAQMDPESMEARTPKFAAALKDAHTATGWERVCTETLGMLATLGEIPLLTRAAYMAMPQRVRLIVGDRDDTVGLTESAAAYAAIPEAELEVLPRTGHAIARVDVARLASSLGACFAG
jgi:pimeloyl-ACP methyl ester carboxylesterase